MLLTAVKARKLSAHGVRQAKCRARKSSAELKPLCNPTRMDPSMTPTRIRIAIGKPAHHRERHPAHHHDDKELPGWAKSREPKIEPPAVNRNIGDVGRWVARASKHSGEEFAPGCGRKSK